MDGDPLERGYLNQVLLWLGVISTPLTVLNTPTAVYIGIVYTICLHDPADLFDAGADGRIASGGGRGSGLFAAYRLLAHDGAPVENGIIAGCFLVFIPVIGEFVIPSLLGGSETLMIGKVLWEEFFNNRDWPVASAVAVILLLILIVPIVLFQINQQKQREAEE